MLQTVAGANKQLQVQPPYFYFIKNFTLLFSAGIVTNIVTFCMFSRLTFYFNNSVSGNFVESEILKQTMVELNEIPVFSIFFYKLIVIIKKYFYNKYKTQCIYASKT